jgi:hypothetical protein
MDDTSKKSDYDYKSTGKENVDITYKSSLYNDIKGNILGDDFWLNDYKVLFTKNNLGNFFPTKKMTVIEKLNAIFRLSIYLSIALYLVTSNYLYFYIFIITGAFTVYIFKTQKDNMDLYFNLNDESFQNIVNKSIIDANKETVKPTVTNPFMNINLITDDKTQEKAPPSWNNENLQKTIEDKFGYNLYRDVGDLYGKSNSQREFYTMPSTTIPNNQTSFAKWLYNTGPTCKEKSIYCTPEMDAVPYIDNTNTMTFTDRLL